MVKRSSNFQLVAGSLILAIVWLVMLLGGTGLADQAVGRALYAGGHPLLIHIARLLTDLGEPTTLIGASIFCALWLWFAGRWRLGATLLAIALVGRGLSELQKIIIARPRPVLESHLVNVKTQSFPSGHATSSMVFYLALALALAGHSRWKGPVICAAILLSLLIGLSRLMLGVHWPSDVVAGWAFGAFWVVIALHPTERLLRADTAKP